MNYVISSILIVLTAASVPVTWWESGPVLLIIAHSIGCLPALAPELVARRAVIAALIVAITVLLVRMVIDGMLTPIAIVLLVMWHKLIGELCS
jgi:hypothetical protein